MKIPVYNTEGKEVESLEVRKEIFAAKVNPSLMAQAIRVHLANRRQGTSSTKTRGEVAGSTRKIWRQKGTGRARHGSIRAPIFVKGGIVFGPKPRDYSLDFPKKMRRLALYSALTEKLQEKSIMAISGLEKVKQKTRDMVKILRNIKFEPEKEKIILVTDGTSENILKASRNLQKLNLSSANALNTYDVLNAQKILFTKEALVNFGKKPIR